MFRLHLVCYTPSVEHTYARYLTEEHGGMDWLNVMLPGLAEGQELHSNPAHIVQPLTLSQDTLQQSTVLVDGSRPAILRFTKSEDVRRYKSSYEQKAKVVAFDLPPRLVMLYNVMATVLDTDIGLFQREGVPMMVFVKHVTTDNDVKAPRVVEGCEKYKEADFVVSQPIIEQHEMNYEELTRRYRGHRGSCTPFLFFNRKEYLTMQVTKYGRQLLFVADLRLL
ncbi:hypothetical protein SPFM20_00096 [Salmonella phage SPFM20]|nr:hypothetical protein SPFM20_00096 [Salmonella phage SPFM20]